MIPVDETSLRTLLENIPVGIGIVGPIGMTGTIKPEGRTVYCNKQWIRMFGFDANAVKTSDEATRRLYPDAAVRQKMIRLRSEAVNRLRDGKGSEQMEVRAMGANGRWRDVVTGTTVVGGRMIVTMFDISKQKQAGDALAALQGKGISGPERVALHRSGSAHQLVAIEAIVAVCGDDKYSMVITRSEKYLDHRRLRDWDELLHDRGFVRLDRSTLVRLTHIKGLTPYGRGARLAILDSKLEIEIGRAGRERLEGGLGGIGAGSFLL